MRCKRCDAQLVAAPELDDGDWIIYCTECRAKNLVEIGLQIVAWRP